LHQMIGAAERRLADVVRERDRVAGTICRQRFDHEAIAKQAALDLIGTSIEKEKQIAERAEQLRSQPADGTPSQETLVIRIEFSVGVVPITIISHSLLGLVIGWIAV